MAALRRIGSCGWRRFIRIRNWTATRTSPRTRPDRHADEPAKKPPSLAKRVRRNPAKFALQLFTVLLSIGLLISSILGVTIALNNRAKRGRTFGLLAAGATLPLILLYV